MRQRKAAKILVGNGGKTVSKALREAGYAEGTVNTPSKVTKSKSWAELMDEFLPRDLVAQQHHGLIVAEETAFAGGKKFKRPDYQARAKGIEMAYKLRGDFAPDQIDIGKRKFQGKSNQELLDIAQKRLKKAKD